MDNVHTFTDKQTLNEEAADWLIRLDGDQPLSAEAHAELQAWLSRSPQHRERLARLAKTWGNLNVLTELAVPLDKPARPRRAMPWLTMPRAGFALASVLVLGLAVLFAVGIFPGNIDRTNGRYITHIGEQQQITLADGTVLELNTNTIVNVEFGEQHRDIHLRQGEAYFQVAKNKRIPFRVFAGNGKVQAVGTAFAVFVKNNDAAVTVTEGRVALAGIDNPFPVGGASARQNPADTRQKSPAPVEENLGVLVAGQGATLKTVPTTQGDKDATNPAVVLDDLRMYRQDELDRQLSWRRGLLIFSGEPLSRVVEEISRYTTANIEIPQAEVRSIKVGGQFEVGDTDLMLTAFEDAFALKVVRKDNNHIVILSGDG